MLVSRTVSGLVADASGWRVVYAVAAVTAAVIAFILRQRGSLCTIRPAAPSSSKPRFVCAALAEARLVVGATGDDVLIGGEHSGGESGEK
jgi:hypothetical protein